MSHIYDIAHSNDLDMLFFNRLIIDEKETPPQPQMDFNLKEPICSGQQYIGNHLDISTGPWHFIIKKQLVDKHELKFPHGIIICEDVDFLARASEVAKRVSYVNVDVYYWIQRSQSVSHFAGKKKMADIYIGNMLWNIAERKKQMDSSKTLLPEFVQWIEIKNHVHAYAILHNAFRYLPVSKSRKIIGKLVDLDEYPLKDEGAYAPKDRMISKMMNHRFLWLFFCGIFNLLPQSIRCKF